MTRSIRFARRAVALATSAVLLAVTSACALTGGSDKSAEAAPSGTAGASVAAATGSAPVPEYATPVTLDSGSAASLDKISFKGGVPNIAYLPMGTEFNYHLALFEGIKSVPGATSFLLSPYAGNDQAAQLGMLQDVTSRDDVDAILIISFDEHSLAPLIKKAVDAGKVVIIVNSDIPNYPTPVDGVVGVNQRAANKKLAEWAVEKAKGEAKQVGILDGEPSYIATERAGGFTDGIAGTNWNVVARVSGGWSVEKGNTAAMDLLQANPTINVLYAANDYMAEGAALAAKALGRSDVTILGYDGDTAAIESIADDGGVTATTNTAPVQMGRVAAQYAIDLLNKKADPGYVEGPTTIVDKDNALTILQKPEDLFPKPSRDF
ncbi:sugar ABC transporter substrate-binding protein [Nakamurella silvestris]|nr:sugar ABC transporter substrate-binding protein [Nakamurella silvestris]